MKKWLLGFLICAGLISGCAGTGFERQTMLVPDSVTIGWGQETYRGDPEAWQGFSASATWVFK